MHRVLLVTFAITALCAFGPRAVAAETVAAQAKAVAIASTARTVMEVRGEHANLRSAPSTKARLIARLNRGTKVEVLARVSAGSWIKVKVGSREGYVKATLLKPLMVSS